MYSFKKCATNFYTDARWSLKSRATLTLRVLSITLSGPGIHGTGLWKLSAVPEGDPWSESPPRRWRPAVRLCARREWWGEVPQWESQSGMPHGCQGRWCGGCRCSRGPLDNSWGRASTFWPAVWSRNGNWNLLGMFATKPGAGKQWNKTKDHLTMFCFKRFWSGKE